MAKLLLKLQPEIIPAACFRAVSPHVSFGFAGHIRASAFFAWPRTRPPRRCPGGHMHLAVRPRNI